MKKWLYHPSQKAKIFDTEVDDIGALVKGGWCESPADFDNEPSAVDRNDDERDQLIEQFHDDPESLGKDNLVKLGRYLGVKMMKAWKEETLIEKVRSGLE